MILAKTHPDPYYTQQAGMSLFFFFYFSSSLFIYNFNINLPFYQVHDYLIFSFNCLNPILKSLSLLVLRCIMVSEAMLIVIIKRVIIYLEYSIKWLLTRCIIGYVSPA